MNEMNKNDAVEAILSSAKVARQGGWMDSWSARAKKQLLKLVDDGIVTREFVNQRLQQFNTNQEWNYPTGLEVL